MKKAFSSLVILFTSLLIISCSKTPFKIESPATNSALVYIYVMSDSSINDTDRIPYYEIKINGKNMEGKIYPYEYLKYNLNADHVRISVARNDIEKKDINLKLERGNRYYLRIISYSDEFGKYKFEQVLEYEALKEIKDTKYAKYEDSNMLDILVDDKKDTKTISTQKNSSKIQKIKDAHKLKEDGIITDQEFQKLKAEILDAN